MRKESLKKNFIMNALLTMSSILFPLITFPYVSRILLPEGMGKIAFATALISYFSMFAQLGDIIFEVIPSFNGHNQTTSYHYVEHDIWSQ